MQTDKNPSYGSVAGTYPLDADGSKVTITEHYVKGMLNNNVKKEYKIRYKVKGQPEEHERYLAFSNQLQEDKGMLDPAFLLEIKRLDGGDGSYYVVEHYTRIEPLIPESTMATVMDYEKGRLR